MLFARALFLASIIAFLLRGMWGGVLFNGIVFLVTLPVPVFGKRDEYYRYDAVLIALFFVASLVSHGAFWNDDPTVVQSLIGFDKIFHAIGGALLAWLAAIWLRPRVKDPLVLCIGVVVFALAIGGAWEVYEWVAQSLPPPWYNASSGYADSMLDMIADTLGSIIVAAMLWTKRTVKRKR
jgi:uncharacterized membrane protein YjdF